MHRSHLPLFKWFLAVYLMCESKKGMSANQLKRTLGVSYKTAWYLCHRIREAMQGGNLDGPTLVGVIEVDETWLDHPENNRKRRAGKLAGRGKQIYIAGAIQRGGKVRLAQIPDLKGPTLKGFIREHVKDEASAIYTDNLKSYVGIADDNTRHEIISHEHEWVRGDVHTNSIENVWSLLKRSIVGSFHQISVKHLGRYLEELEWRFNNRDNPHIFRDTMRRLMDTDPLKYKALTA
jgi:transposase-like protein